MKRDLRDPKYVGERLEDLRMLADDHAEGPFIPLSVLYDLNGADVPDYKGEMTGFYTAQQYRKELEARESVGDIYAASTLERIDGKQNPEA